MFEVFLTLSFAKEFKKIEKKERIRIKKKLFSAAENPNAFFERLTHHNLFKLRVGKYRLIAQISWPKKKITLLSVKHRQAAYRNLVS